MTRNLFAIIAFASIVAAGALAGCYKTPDRECAFACEFGGSELCPDGYTCRADNLCKRDDVADSFTVQELEAAIAFYDSPIGRSVVRNQVDLNAELQEVMMRLLIPRVTDLMEKYCLRFDCTAVADAAAKRDD